MFRLNIDRGCSVPVQLRMHYARLLRLVCRCDALLHGVVVGLVLYLGGRGKDKTGRFSRGNSFLPFNRAEFMIDRSRVRFHSAIADSILMRIPRHAKIPVD